MFLRTIVRDCLFLNWAFPQRACRRRRHHCATRPTATAARTGFSSRPCSFARPASTCRTCRCRRCPIRSSICALYVLDRDGVASVLFWRMLVPAWVVPGARLVGRQPARRRSLRLSPAPASPIRPARRWRVRAGAELDVLARPGMPALGEGPCLANWNALVDTLRQRPRGYGWSGGRLRGSRHLIR